VGTATASDWDGQPCTAQQGCCSGGTWSEEEYLRVSADFVTDETSSQNLRASSMIKILLSFLALVWFTGSALAERPCGFGFWRVGETCRAKSGKICTITNVRGGRSRATTSCR
jgi:hypothetical protein